MMTSDNRPGVRLSVGFDINGDGRPDLFLSRPMSAKECEQAAMGFLISMVILAALGVIVLIAWGVCVGIAELVRWIVSWDKTTWLIIGTILYIILPPLYIYLRSKHLLSAGKTFIALIASLEIPFCVYRFGLFGYWLAVWITFWSAGVWICLLAAVLASLTLWWGYTQMAISSDRVRVPPVSKKPSNSKRVLRVIAPAGSKQPMEVEEFAADLLLGAQLPRSSVVKRWDGWI